MRYAIEHPSELLADLKDCPAGLIYVFSHGYTPFAFPAWLDAFRRGLKRRKTDPAAAMLLQVLQREDFAQDDAWIELRCAPCSVRIARLARRSPT